MPSMQKWRFGIIGAGLIGSGLDAGKTTPFAQTHASAILKNPATELVALCNTNAALLAAAGRARGINRLYTSCEDMLANEQLDAVSICTPTNVRLPIFKAVLAAGIKRIWCEKPLAHDLATAQEIIALLKKHGALCNVNYPRRYSPALARLHQIVQQQSLGAITGVHAVYTKGVWNNGSHIIDTMMAVLGKPSKAMRLAKVEDGRTEDPTYSLYLEFTGVAGQIIPAHITALPYQNYSIMDWDSYFEKGRVQLVDKGRTQIIHHVVPDPLFAGYTVIAPQETFTDGFDAMFENALENTIAAKCEADLLCAAAANADLLAVLSEIS